MMRRGEGGLPMREGISTFEVLWDDSLNRPSATGEIF